MSEDQSRTRQLAWWYPKGQWSGHWPCLSVDEWGFHTLVIPFPGERALVIGLHRCRCEGCGDLREQSARWEREQDTAWEFWAANGYPEGSGAHWSLRTIAKRLAEVGDACSAESLPVTLSTDPIDAGVRETLLQALSVSGGQITDEERNRAWAWVENHSGHYEEMGQ